MDTKSRRRVVVRADSQRRNLEAMSGGPRGNKSESEPPLNETAQEDPSPSAVLPHSTPLHPTFPPSFRSTPSPTSSHTSLHHHRESATVQFPVHQESGLARTPDKRQRKRKWRRKRTQIHPVTDGVPRLMEDQTPPTAFLPPTTPSSPPQSSNGRQVVSLSPAIVLSPDRDLSCSLPPLLSSQARKGGRKASASTDWSSCGLTQLERCLPVREMGLFVGTWNMQQMSTLPECLDDFLLPAGVETVPELYVVGTQESTGQLKEWEILVQQTLGPSHLLLSSSSLGELTVLLFLRRDLLWFCSEVQSAGYSTRPGSAVKTKGGVGLSFSLFGSTFLFVSSHLTAHQDRVEDRNNDMKRIAANLTTNKLSEFDYVFWLGDLNYRLNLDRGQVDTHLSQWQLQQRMEEGEDGHQDGWLALLLHDQLTKEMLHGHVFQGFSEQPVTFPPSYKFDLNSDVYDTRRVPSWTDRILFRSRAGSGVSGCGYDICRSLKCSDHRPVYAEFRVRLEPCTDTDGVPETMAEFNRDVYRIAQRRRREVAALSLSLREGVDSGGLPPAARTSRHVTSSFCSIL